MPQWPKYGALLEWGFFVPVVGFMSVKSFRNELSHLAIVAIHSIAILFFAFGIIHRIHIMITSSVLIAVVCWLYLLFRINYGTSKIIPPAELKIVEMCSPTSYLLAYPLIFSATRQSERIIGIALFLLHIITVPSIAILIWATELHDAWGCYGSQRRLKDYDKGMCGQWNVDQIQICRDIQKEQPTNTDCTSNTTPFEFFGVLFHRIVQFQVISVTLWIHTMIIQYYLEKKTNHKLHQL
tara:strand:+ start:2308 stop:3024 length:717 start_codon:yes stop_codon:yes gene_type:complete